MPVEFKHNGLLIDGELLPVYSGSVHYWRLEKKLWNDILDNIIRMGFKVIETYIPWSVHEIEEGKYDFGQVRESNDLDGFLSLCEGKGLKIFVRPGPHINAELTLYGFPERILYDEDIQAKTPWGTRVIFPNFPKQFPIPGYASEKLYLETGKYFDALAPILLKHQYPQGGIVAVQADNETCYFFQRKAYVMDYSTDSIKLYRKMLQEKYVSINALNREYHTKYDSFDMVVPPTGFCGNDKKDLSCYFDWVEYKEYQVLYALKRLAVMWKDRGIHLPIYHNSAGEYYTPVDFVNTEQTPEIAVEGIDIYYSQTDIHERIRYAAGSSKLPFCPEFGSGICYDWQGGYLSEESEFSTLYAFMLGMKAVNYYMIVERDRWRGSPITSDNRIREEYFEFYRKLNLFLENERFHDFERRPKVLLMRNYDYARFKLLYSIMNLNLLYSDCLLKGPVFPAALFKPRTDLGFKYIDDDSAYTGFDMYVGYEREKWIEKASEKLLKDNLDFNYSDSHLPLEKMLEYPVIFASTYDFMSRLEQEKLVAYAQMGGKLVIGPGVPYLDRQMNECRVIEEIINEKNRKVPWGNGYIMWVENPGQLCMEELGVEAKYRTDNKNIEMTLHQDMSREFLFVANKSCMGQLVRITFKGDKSFKAKWNGENLSGKDMVEITMKENSVSVWEVCQDVITEFLSY